MTDIEVQALAEDDWEQYRQVRLAALRESPEAFVAQHDDEAGYDEDFWRQRMRRSQRLLARADGQAVGIVSIGDVDDPDGNHIAELFGLWVEPQARGTGVATALVRAGASNARAGGNTHLTYWVGTDNGRAVAFASGFGFRPTDKRRSMRVVSEEDGEEETAMILPLAGDTTIPDVG